MSPLDRNRDRRSLNQPRATLAAQRRLARPLPVASNSTAEHIADYAVTYCAGFRDGWEPISAGYAIRCMSE